MCIRDSFIDNYDSTMKEPTLLQVSFPSILVHNNVGIAVGMASSICSFNLQEVCDTAIALMKDPESYLSHRHQGTQPLRRIIISIISRSSYYHN